MLLPAGVGLMRHPTPTLFLQQRNGRPTREAGAAKVLEDLARSRGLRQSPATMRVAAGIRASAATRARRGWRATRSFCGGNPQQDAAIRRAFALPPPSSPGAKCRQDRDALTALTK